MLISILKSTCPGKAAFTAIALAITLGAAAANAAAASVVLGAAETFAVLGATTITNTGDSVITGELGLYPGTSITGFPPGTVSGTIHQTDAAAMTAQADALTAYTHLAGLAPNADLMMMNLGGLTLTPGVYALSAAQLTGTLTLDGAGLFVFQIDSTLTTAANASIVLIDGADAGDIFFQVGSSATLGTGTMFEGTIIASASNTLNTGAIVNGRVIALTGAVTLDTNTINVTDALIGSDPVTVVPTPSAAAAGLLGLGIVALRRSRRHRTA